MLMYDVIVIGFGKAGKTPRSEIIKPRKKSRSD